MRKLREEGAKSSAKWTWRPPNEGVAGGNRWGVDMMAIALPGAAGLDGKRSRRELGNGRKGRDGHSVSAALLCLAEHPAHERRADAGRCANVFGDIWSQVPPEGVLSHARVYVSEPNT